MIMVVAEEDAPAVQRALADKGEICYRIGRVVAGESVVKLKGGAFGA